MKVFSSKRVSDSCSDHWKSKIQKRHRGRKLVGTFTIALTFALGGAVARAQQPKKVPHIGVLRPGSATDDPNFDPFRQGLRELGYVEGKNIVIEYRYAGESSIGCLTLLRRCSV